MKRADAARRLRLTEARLTFLVPFVAYVLVGAFLVFHANLIMGDALARVGIAHRILFSRDPHLAAIGFVWSPLPMLLLLPLVPLKAVWPALVEVGFAGNVLSALFMAGAVSQVRGFLADLGLGRGARLALTIAFAAHPMIVFFGANAMTEAQFVFLLLVALRQLARWLRTSELSPLVNAALALGLAYLTRYELAAAAAVACLVVAAVTYRRTHDTRSRRLGLAVCDAVIVGGPFVLAFALWSGISWLITGVAFAQSSSVYGTTAQLQSKGFGASSVIDALGWGGHALEGIIGLEPFLPLLLVAGLVLALRRRDPVAVATIAFLSSVVGLMLWAYATGSILRELRYVIVSIPLAVLVAGVCLASFRAARPRGAWGGAALSAAVAAMLAAALPTGAAVAMDPAFSPSDGVRLQIALRLVTPSSDQMASTRRFVEDRAVAAYIDSLHLSRGSVLLDDFIGFSVILDLRRPEQFVITSDRDFARALDDPASAGIRYVLVPPPHSILGALDAVNRAYPSLYDTGADVATLVHRFTDSSDAHYDWKLYRVAAKA